MSFVELGLVPPSFFLPPGTIAGTGGALSALRAFRIMRVFKLFGYGHSVNHLSVSSSCHRHSCLGIHYHSSLSCCVCTVLPRVVLSIQTHLLTLPTYHHMYHMYHMHHMYHCRSFKGLRRLIGIILTALEDVVYFGVLLILMMFIFSLVGMQFFSNKFHFDSMGLPVKWGEANFASVDRPRGNFDNLLWAFTSVFQILTGENWPDLMYDAWRSTGMAGAIYFVLVMMVGNWILFNLLLAILLGHFMSEPDDDEDEEEEGSGDVGKDELEAAAIMAEVSRE